MRHLLLFIGLALSVASGGVRSEESLRAVYRGSPIEFTARDGMAIYEGDIVLGTVNELLGRVPAKSTANAFAVASTNYRWPKGASGVHEIPYVYSGITHKPMVDDAIAAFNQVFAGTIQWVPRSGQPDYVAIDANAGCQSNVGRIGGQQYLGAGGCGEIGSVFHEMGHTVGLWHTQQDRSTGAAYVAHPYEDPRFTQNVPVLYMSTTTLDGYDYGSIMHYGTLAAPRGEPIFMETRPRGIDIGQRRGFSTGDVDSIKRLYGTISQAITVDTNPPGLDVVVDGVVVKTPHVVQWALGSVHRLDVPQGLQQLGAFSFGFGRWSHDPSVDPRASQLYIVESGDGTPWAPANAPKHGALIANFVRLIKVVPTTLDAAYGQVTLKSDGSPWPGSADLYPQWTRFDIDATAQPGRLAAAIFNGYWIRRDIGTVTSSAGRLSGDASSQLGTRDDLAVQLVGADFRTSTALVLKANDPAIGVAAAVWNATGPASSVNWGLPLAVTPGWISKVGETPISAGAAARVEAASTGFGTPSVRHELKSIAGLDDAASGIVIMPASGLKYVTANYETQFQPYVQANPACGGSVTLSDTRTWVPAGKPLTVSAVPSGGAVFAGWGGTVSGKSSSVVDPATAIPRLIANFNAIPEPLAVESIEPGHFFAGSAATTFTIKGSGFTGNPSVTLGERGPRGSVQVVDSRTLKVTLTSTDVGSPGTLAVFVSQLAAPGCSVLSGSVPLKVRASGSLPGNGEVKANPYGAITAQGATVGGAAITGFARDAIIQLGSTTGTTGSFVQIDISGLSVGAGNSLTIRAGAPGQTVYLNDVSGVPTSIGGMLRMEAGNGAPAPAAYLHNPAGVIVLSEGVVRTTSTLTLDTLGTTPLTGGGIVHLGSIDGGGSLTLRSAQVIGGGAFRGNAITVSTFGNANNPANGARFLSNGLQLHPSTGNTVALTVNHYGEQPQVINLMVNGNASLLMPSGWQSGSTLSPNNAPVPAGGVRPPGTPPPPYGGGSIIVQATGNMTLAGGATSDLVFPGGLVLKAAGMLDLGNVLVNQGWTTTGRSFQGIFFDSPNIVSATRIGILSNDLNWTNFSTLPHAKVDIATLVLMPDGSEQYLPADGVATHLNSYSLVTEAAASGACWVCLINITPVDLH